ELRDADDLHDALRGLGDLTTDEVAARSRAPDAAPEWLRELEASRRALPVRVAGEERWIAAEDASRYRDALGVAPPPGVPESLLEPVADPLGDLVARFARTHGPFVPTDVAARLGLGAAVVETALHGLQDRGRGSRGGFRPGAAGREWVDAEVLRRVRSRSLAALRKEVEPAPRDALARFLLAWQGVGPAAPPRADVDALYRVLQQLQGVP